MDALKEPTRSDELTTERHPLLLFFDGECAFCNRWVNRVKAADHAHRIRYGTKQGQTFRVVAQAHPQLANVESIVLVKRRGAGGEDFLVRSAAIREIIDGLPGFGLFERLLKVVPLPFPTLGTAFFPSSAPLSLGDCNNVLYLWKKRKNCMSNDHPGRPSCGTSDNIKYLLIKKDCQSPKFPYCNPEGRVLI